VQDGILLVTFTHLKRVYTTLHLSLLAALAALNAWSQAADAQLTSLFQSASAAYVCCRLGHRLLAHALSAGIFEAGGALEDCTNAPSTAHLPPLASDPIVTLLQSSHASNSSIQLTGALEAAGMFSQALDSSDTGSHAADVIQGPHPRSLEQMLSGEPNESRLATVASIAFTLAVLYAAPPGSPAMALPLVWVTCGLLQTSRGPGSLELQACRHLFMALFDTPNPPAPSTGSLLSSTLRAHSPWSCAACGLEAAELFVYAAALGARNCESAPVALETPGAMLAAVLSTCAQHPGSKCHALVATVAAVEARPPGSAVSKEHATALSKRTCTLLGGCEVGAVRWVMTLTIAVWNLLAPQDRSEILWQLVQLLMHAEVRVEVATADALCRLAQLQGVSVEDLLVGNEHVMREAGLHAASHQQVCAHEPTCLVQSWLAHC
jgi:hypothetical protein